MTAAADEPHIGLVVEGPGDLRALPILLRALQASDGCYCDTLGKPVPLNGRSNAVKANGIEGYVATAAARSGSVAILIVVDADGHEDPTVFTSSMEGRGQGVTPKPVRLVLAEPEFEQWIYASAETLELGFTLHNPAVRGFTAIREALAPVKYVKPVWQPKLTSRMDTALALSRDAGLTALATIYRELRAAIPCACRTRGC